MQPARLRLSWGSPHPAGTTHPQGGPLLPGAPALVPLLGWEDLLEVEASLVRPVGLRRGPGLPWTE